MSTNWEDTLLFGALRRQVQSRRPVWLMRQAGRYLPEYRQLRKEAGGFLQLMKTPEMACEVTLQPIRRFGFDAAIIFSDILTIPDAMGLGLHFVEGEGPNFSHPLTDEKSIAALSPPDLEQLDYVFKACELTRANLPAQTPLIGFCGSPWTLACYMIDGKGGGDFQKARQMRYARPDLLRRVVDINARACADLLCAQVAAGAQAVMIFDSWGGLLDSAGYEEFSLQPIAEIVAAVKQKTDAPVIVFSRQCGFHLPKIAACGCDAIGVDWQVSLMAAQRMACGRVAVQGNLDPMALLSSPESAAAATQKMLEDYGHAPGHIVNLGHGIDKKTPPENVSAMIETVRNFQVKAA